jgi:5-methyltetrahydrofolate--homocysteine methyltransferase
MEPYGSLSRVEAQSIFAEQAVGLIAGGVDFILIETMSDLEEVGAALTAVRQVDPEILTAVTMTFDTKYRTMMGVSPRQAMDALTGWGIRVMGANCGNGPDEILVVVTEMANHRLAGTYLVAQSNAGLPRYADGETKFDGSPEVMADLAVELRHLGVDVIGACCGSTPAHIAAMKRALNSV